MLTPISDATRDLYKPLNLYSMDRMAISLAEHRETDELGVIHRTKNYDKFIVNIYGAAYENPDGSLKKRPDGGLDCAWPSANALRRFTQRIPERKQLDNNSRGERWEFAATDITASLIQALWIQPAIDAGEKIPVEFADDAREVFDELIVKCLRLNRNVEVIANYKEKKLVPDMGDLQWCADRPLSPYQQVALYLNHTNDAFAENMEQGTGKTAPLIAKIDNAALEKEKENGEGSLLTVLVVCPKQVRTNWETEIANFSTVDGKVTVLRGTEMDRLRAFIDSGVPGTVVAMPKKARVNVNGCKYSVVICSYDILHRMEALTNFPWDIAILDEAHSIKDSGTKRWAACDKLRVKAKKRYTATGTPICNTICDLWTQLEFLGKGASGFLNQKNFKDFYSVYDDNSRKTVGYQNLPFIQEQLARYSFFISKKEALPDLPEKVYQVLEVEMDSYQAEVYNKVAQDLMFRIESELAESDNDAITVNNILTQLLRLAQITSGFVTWDAVYDDEGNVIKEARIERFEKQNKIDMVLEILKNKKPEEKTLIWACWVSDIEALAAAIRKYNNDNPNAQLGNVVTYYGDTKDSDRELAVWDFNNDPNCKIFIGNPASGGSGLNLLGYPPQHPELSDSNVTEEIFFSQNWSSMYRAQSEDRAHRRGTRNNVTITDLQCWGTIDVEIRNRVAGKRQAAYEISDLKEILRMVLRTNLNLCAA